MFHNEASKKVLISNVQCIKERLILYKLIN